MKILIFVVLVAGCAVVPVCSDHPWTEYPSWACHMEDSCGIYPPLYAGAEYCGPPQIVCPGEKWLNPTEAARIRGGVRYDGVGMSHTIACGKQLTEIK